MGFRIGSVRSRAITIIGLVALVFGLTVWYGTLAPAPALGAYPDAGHLATDTDPVTILAAYGANETIRLTVTDLTVAPTEGDTLRIYGVVEGDQTVRALSAFTVPQSGQWYAWGISFLAELWVLPRIIRHWRLDRTDWTLTPRAIAVTSPLADRPRTRIHHLRNY